jgi:quaternary ammonium compound-resistance protein SugE
VVFAAGLKASAGLTKPALTAVTLSSLVGSLMLLTAASRHLPIGTAYAVWTGIGAAGTALVGFTAFGEHAGWMKIGCILLILTGVAGLKTLE